MSWTRSIRVWRAAAVGLTLLAQACSGASDEARAALAARHPGWPAALVDWAARAAAEFGAPTVTLEQLPEGALLLDVRTPEERRVSALPGALALEEQPELPSDRPVVVYCTVGWRSAEATLALRERGVQAWNLEGGICAWAAAGKPLLDEHGRPTRTIHTYSSFFSGLVPEGFEGVSEAPEPGSGK